jgi:hypothetical protein
MMPIRRRRLASLIALSAAAAACGGGGGSGDAAPSPPDQGPVPPPPPDNPPSQPGTALLLTRLLDFAETAARNWNFGGHQVPVPFDVNQGYWAYTNTTFEPWLFDRPQAWRMLAEMAGAAGDPRWQALAASDLAYYESRLSAGGIFLNKTGEDDTKYSYVHPWSGNLAKQTAAYQATVAGFADVPVLGPSSLWTERELWVGLHAAVQYQQVAPGAAVLARAQAMVDQWDTVCAGRKAPLVTYTQHEGGGPGGTRPTDLVTSPWMSALYFQAARLYLQHAPSAAAQVHRQASDYFDWLNTPGTRGFYPAEQAHAQFAGLVFPAYLAGGTLIGDAGAGDGDIQHALDVAGFVAFAVRAKQALGLPVVAAGERLAQMKSSALASFGYWTRPNSPQLPRYRIQRPRMFNWWTRGLYELLANGG